MIKAAIMGITGYTGEELFHLLLNHPEVEVSTVTARTEEPVPIADKFPRFYGKTSLSYQMIPLEEIAASSDVVFLALPHTVSVDIAGEFIKLGEKVIDLSADFRLKDADIYRAYYNKEHSQPALLKESVYGMPELFKSDIGKANIIANPGCFPTGVILACAPIVKNISLADSSIIINSITGITGAGRKASLPFHFSETNEDIRAYKVMAHQHTPEIKQELETLTDKKLDIMFTPHVAPLDRGIFSTCYLKLAKSVSAAELTGLYKEFYKGCPFINVLEGDSLPRLKDVRGTNLCQIAVRVNPVSGFVIVLSAIDNLMKGASGQAVHNMNIMFGLDETLGL